MLLALLMMLLPLHSQFCSPLTRCVSTLQLLGMTVVSEELIASLWNKETWVDVGDKSLSTSLATAGHFMPATTPGLLLSIRPDSEGEVSTQLMYGVERELQDDTDAFAVLSPPTAPKQSIPGEDLLILERTIGVSQAAVDGSVAIWSIAQLGGLIFTGSQDGKIKVYAHSSRCLAPPGCQSSTAQYQQLRGTRDFL